MTRLAVVGYEGLYEVTDTGGVYSLDRVVKRSDGETRNRKGRKLKTWTNSKGYEITEVSKNSVRKSIPVHRLVALAFIPNPENKPTVNHKDTNKQNNNVENLEWATHLENVKHANAHGLVPRMEGSLNGQSKLNEKQVLDIRESWEAGATQTILAKHYNVTLSTINGIILNKSWQSVRPTKERKK